MVSFTRVLFFHRLTGSFTQAETGCAYLQLIGRSVADCQALTRPLVYTSSILGLHYRVHYSLISYDSLWRKICRLDSIGSYNFIYVKLTLSNSSNASLNSILCNSLNSCDILPIWISRIFLVLWRKCYFLFQDVFRFVHLTRVHALLCIWSLRLGSILPEKSWIGLGCADPGLTLLFLRFYCFTSLSAIWPSLRSLRQKLY